MSYVYFNPNPTGRRVEDCAVRAICAALGTDWRESYDLLTERGRELGDMPHADSVWGAVLRDHGFVRRIVPNTCPDCYTAAQFCLDHPRGAYVLAFGGHVAAVVHGRIFDSWDSSEEIPIYFYEEV